ncbi:MULTISPECIES: glutathione S-transferase [unclassified Pseudomonas]|uniref:glutathione S-transferase n=1 Tax=unclassified Pseudomonas TaxID=196821 RepID=UPI000C88146F|nr:MULTISPECIES: glutathione S-transferase [unclassified Pseudomonas]PMZ96318.1 glutathione S-transferase [Pseudomonas sp. FW305-42]PNA28341.1 glutathione S-transferase [Pseudomonas sp. MPR-R1B]PNB28807.1 glutathione S-transferase [Pseudomonas sp. DP16D-E2]PNB45446.1 glutathione S-transferase [Pseudomonas sp. FW305-17]PNB64534.1 glutathione S-transferase [Pseudomonas sp. GW531-E2]
MLKLHGFAVSNYYNMVKLALLEKGVPFEEVPFFGGQLPQALAISPRGKVPVLQTEHGFISETGVILDYIEQTQPGKALLPADAFGQAKVRELLREIELYIELPARTCYAEAFFGAAVEPLIKERARADLLAGFATLKRNGRFAPYVAGEQLTIADLMFCFSVDLACAVGKKVLNIDFLADFPEAKALLQLLGENPHMARIVADKDAAMPAFLEMIKNKR